MELHSQIPPAQLADALARLTPKNLPKAISAAVNRTASTTRTLLRRATATQLGIKQSDANRIGLVKSSEKSLTAKLVVGRKRFSLRRIAGATDAYPNGVVLARQVEGAGDLSHAFIAKGKNGNLVVFRRKPGRPPVDHWRWINGRPVPITKQVGAIEGVSLPSLAQVARQTGILGSVMGQTAPILQKNMASQIDRFLAKQQAEE